MKRINSSRQSHVVAHRNCNYRKSGHIAHHVIQATMINELASKRFLGEKVIRCLVHELIICGDVVVEVGQMFYLIASKFAPRYYVVAAENPRTCASARRKRIAHLPGRRRSLKSSANRLNKWVRASTFTQADRQVL